MAPKNERFEMRLDEAILERVDVWRSQQADLPSRAEAMRRLIERSLTKTSSTEVVFTDGERLIAIMLADLLKQQKTRGEIDPSFVTSAIFGGHNWAFQWQMPGLFQQGSDDSADVRFVVDTLDMWVFVESALNALSKKDRDAITKDAASKHWRTKFLGFDGNNESALLSVANFLINEMGRFTQFKGRELNSHMPIATDYQRMLSVFLPIRSKLIGGSLSSDQLLKIVSASRP
jgi:uncharacterized protein